MTNSFFFVLIFIAGLITALTDLLQRKIKNHHQVFIAAAAVLWHIINAVTHKTIPTQTLLSLTLAVVISITFYLMHLWRAGDAKLFSLYSLLMPPTGYEAWIPLPSILLFANTFIAGAIILTPSLARTFFLNRTAIMRAVLRQNTRSFLFSLSISWIIFPLLAFIGLTQQRFFPLLPFLLVFILTKPLYEHTMPLFKQPIFCILVFSGGLTLHILLRPEFFLWTNMLLYLRNVLIYTILTNITLESIKHTADPRERFPFAPFLFLGCLLSYTPFLNKIFFLLKQ